MRQLRYLFRSAKKLFHANISCPACNSTNTRVIKRKYIVTSLRHCLDCDLMYRIPKDDKLYTDAFYQSAYSHGFTTDCPNDEQLMLLKSSKFQGTEKDYVPYIAILQAVGINPGASILDFGASWGYGSWQFAEAGYKVFTYEISKPRARFAAEKMNCHVIESVDELVEPVDCFFSAHVIEHLTDPNDLWTAGSKALKTHGKIITITPNGERSREAIHKRKYHNLWGEVHPLLLTEKSLSNQAAGYGFSGIGYSTPYDFQAIRNGRVGSLSGGELLFIAQRMDGQNG